MCQNYPISSVKKQCTNRGKHKLIVKITNSRYYRPMKNNQSGFIHLTLLIVVVLVLVGVGGYFGYKALYPADKMADASKTTDTTNQATDTKDPTEDWKTYRSDDGAFRIKHPDSWITDTCEGMSAVYLTPPDGVRVKCGSEKGAQIAFYASKTALSAGETEFEDDMFTDVTSEKVVLGGVEGKKMTGKTKEPVVGMLAETLFVQYFFVVDDTTHIAAYVQAPMGEYSKDYLKEFETMVTETWRFGINY